jgi:hypothetical protein
VAPNATAQEAVTIVDKKHYGSTLDSLFEEIGALQEMNERLSKRIFVEQLSEATRRQRISLSRTRRERDAQGGGADLSASCPAPAASRAVTTVAIAPAPAKK